MMMSDFLVFSTSEIGKKVGWIGRGEQDLAGRQGVSGVLFVLAFAAANALPFLRT